MNTHEALDTLNEIKDLMQKSSRFQTISGLSIVIIGIYASLVSFAAWLLLTPAGASLGWLHDGLSPMSLNTPARTWVAIAAAALLVALSFGTVCVMSYAKTKRQNHHFSFDQTVRRPLFHFFVPAITGGLLCIALLMQGHYGLTSSIMLLFYGLALINCAHYTTSDIALLGYGQLLLGIVDCFLIRHGLLFWFLGFGLWHILFGLYFTFKNARR